MKNDKIESSKERWKENEKESINRIKWRHTVEARKRDKSEKTQEDQQIESWKKRKQDTEARLGIER